MCILKENLVRKKVTESFLPIWKTREHVIRDSLFQCEFLGLSRAVGKKALPIPSNAKGCTQFPPLVWEELIFKDSVRNLACFIACA